MKPNRKGEVKASENVLKLFQTSEGSYLSYMIMMAAYRSTHIMQIMCAYICIHMYDACSKEINYGTYC